MDMYIFAATDSILDGVSNIYVLSIATAFLAVIMAFYCSNFLKDESENQSKEGLNGCKNESGEEDKNEQNNTKMKNYAFEQEFNKQSNLEEISNCSTNENSDIDSDMDEVHVNGLVGKLKSKRVRDLESQLTRDQLEEEKRIEREQLAAIFELLKKQEAELNMKEIDESELNAQLSLYR